MAEWIIPVLTGGVAAAFVSGVVRIVEVYQNHKHEKNKTESAEMTALKNAMRAILHDRIKYLSRAFIENCAVSFDDRRDLIDMHSIYHDNLGGNGNLDHLMSEVKKLPLK